jgi:hypothetical protein
MRKVMRAASENMQLGIWQEHGKALSHGYRT